MHACLFIFSFIKWNFGKVGPDLFYILRQCSIFLKGLRHEDFSVLGQFCAIKIITYIHELLLGNYEYDMK